VNPTALLIAEAGGRIVGTLIAAWDGWRGNFYRLVVVPDHRRRGVGSALVRAGEQRLCDQGAIRVSALVIGNHDDAVAFWRAAGYTWDQEIIRFVKTPTVSDQI